MKTAALAALMGAAAALVATGVLILAGPGVTALEWSGYDRWLRWRAPLPVSSDLLVVTRDPSSEAHLGTGVWDRALVAELIMSLARSGAAVIGVDAALGQPSAPGRGGASSDALLSQTLALVGNVVFPIALDPVSGPSSSGRADAGPTIPAPAGHPAWPALSKTSRELLEARARTAPLSGVLRSARGVGHTLAPADADGVVRRVPLFVRLGERGVPALGLSLAAAFRQGDPTRIRADRDGRVLVSFAGSAFPQGFNVVTFADLLTAIDERQTETLEKLVAGRIVLLLLEPSRAPHATPLGPMSDGAIQAQLLNTVLTNAWVRRAPAAWGAIVTALLAALTAWLWLAARWWKAAIGVLVVVLAYAAGLIVVPARAGLLLPVVAPLVAIVVSSAGAFVWNQLSSGNRIRRLEDEVGAIREALVRHESQVEGLEEDLEAARAAVARSTGTEEGLRAQLAAARAQEEQTRARLERLEREARSGPPLPLSDAAQERLRGASERVGIVTRDPALLAAFRDLEKAARSSLPVLVAGEPGTGKELFARAVHRLSPRAEAPFVAVNMAAIPAELFESEMFGHVRGSFTGAVGDRKGHFEQASRGTIFLDEVGELRPEHQSKLLRVLQDKSFHRVGATRPTTVDVRVVAASNRDLERGVAEGWFREDLYFRLKGLVLRLPPLRERRQDIPLLAARFLQEAAAEAGRPAPALSPAALAALERSDWPGNARELQNCLRQALALADGAEITAEDLRLTPRESGRDEPGGDAAVLASLRQHGFDMQATARALGWDRSTVTQRLKGLGFRALVEAGGDRRKAALELAGDPALGRTVELKLREYSEHLTKVVAGFPTADEAIAACRRRFKNLPERHFRSLELLVRQSFARRAPSPSA
jgi:DNA-binding NtrC family response regulator/CHASE2 domain-containing sensor protein